MVLIPNEVQRRALVHRDATKYEFSQKTILTYYDHGTDIKILNYPAFQLINFFILKFNTAIKTKDGQGQLFNGGILFCCFLLPVANIFFVMLGTKNVDYVRVNKLL